MNKKSVLTYFSITIVIIVFIFGGIYFFRMKNGIKTLLKNDKIANEFIQEDSLKLLSLNFLLENAEDKYVKRKYFFNQYDLNNVNKNYLFQNIEQSILISKKRLNSELFTTDQFLNYILPYRLRYEKLENWKDLAANKFDTLYNDDIFIHVKNINDELKKTFTYSLKSRANRKVSDLFANCYGSCNEMSDLAAFSMRANGIPVAVDFAKWSNIRGGHQWNSLQTKDKNIPFMGIESEPTAESDATIIVGNYKRFAKVYRKTFKKYDEKYKKYNPKKEINKVNYTDVTKEYCPECKNINLDFPNETINNEVFFLCIYEVDKWIPVDFAFGENNRITFTDVCPNNIFTLKKRKNNQLTYFKTPFTFNTNGEVSFVETDLNNKVKVKLTFDNSNYRELIEMFNEIGLPETVAIQDSILSYNYTGIVNEGRLYKLFYWENEWKFVDEQMAEKGEVLFSGIPKNALYKLEDINDPKSFKNRCFTLDSNNTQNWW